MDSSSSLVDAGLSENEAELYLLLTRFGQMKASELATKAGIQRRTAYDVLAQLEKKGLVGKAEVSGVLTFSASPPSALLSFLDEKRSALEEVLPSLSKSFEEEDKTKVSVLYGVGGIKTVLEDILELKADYYSYHGQLQFYDLIPKFITLFHAKCKKFGIKTRYLLLDVPEARKHYKTMQHAQIKFLTAQSISAGVWWTYADRLVLFVLPKEQLPITIFIKNSELASAFKRAFNELFEATPGKIIAP